MIKRGNPIAPDTKRDVEIALNLLALHHVHEKEHFFEANILMHLKWDASPVEENGLPWRPWIGFHNVKDVHDVRNDAMPQYTKQELHEKVFMLDRSIGSPAPVIESRHFVGKFLNEMALGLFPFDSQELSISIVVCFRS